MLRLYRAGDEGRVDARWDFRAAYSAEGRLPTGPKWSLIDDGAVIAVGGLEDLGGGYWAAWAYAARLTPRQWVAAARKARETLDWFCESFKVATVQAVPAPAPAYHEGAVRLLGRMGFGPHPAYRGLVQRRAA